MKLWEKGILTDRLVEQFTVGDDRKLDMLLAPYDILGSIAHAVMLHEAGLLDEGEMKDLRGALIGLFQMVEEGKFDIEPEVEDVHSQVEMMLTERLGETGKKIHTARSRNDQVLLDLKLFMRNEIQQIVFQASELFQVLIRQSNEYKDYILPGYTHLQVAMPSSFGLWFAAFAESLTDDLYMMEAAFHIVNQNPLGSAAGYGSSFPVDRQLTTELLGFEHMNVNVVYAQMSRGKTERTVSFAMASLAATISRMANDVCLFSSQNFGFVELPDEITTGSSIMPHKKNPDVFEILRARCNKIQALPGEIDHVAVNLPSGYFRDYQIIKESFLPAFATLHQCLDVATHMIARIKPVKDIIDKDIYRYIYSVEEVNKLVMKGLPFREAYQEVARQIRDGDYRPEKDLKHVHTGSIGNLSNEKIAQKMDEVMKRFDFEKINKALEQLLKP